MWGIFAPLSSSGAVVAGLALVVSGATFIAYFLFGIFQFDVLNKGDYLILPTLFLSCSLGLLGAGIATYLAAFGNSAVATSGIALLTAGAVLTIAAILFTRHRITNYSPPQDKWKYSQMA